MADGGVHFVKNQVDLSVWRALSTTQAARSSVQTPTDPARSRELHVSPSGDGTMQSEFASRGSFSWYS